MEALQSPPPPSTQARAGGAATEVARAAREEDGWNTFVSTAAWWLGENANELCEEFCGRKLTPTAIPGSVAAALPASASRKSVGAAAAAAGSDGEEAGGALGSDEDDSDDREADAAAAAVAAAAAASAAELMQQFGGRSPTLSRILLALQNLMLTAVWQLRLAAAQVGVGDRGGRGCSLGGWERQGLAES